MSTETQEQTITATGTTTTPAKDAASAALKMDSKYTAGIKGFRFAGGYAFLTVLLNGKNENIIIGDAQTNSVQSMVALKGLSAEFTYKGVKTVNGIDYPRFSLDCIVF
jgi:hypothetical protein